MSLMKLPTRPTTLTQTGKRLAGAKTGIGAHQKAALAYAIQTGFYLHLANDMCEHGEYGPWLEKHFDGSVARAKVYAQIARAYSSAPSHFTGCEDIESALKVARSLPKPEGLPAWLPDLLEPPEPASRPDPEQRALPAKTGTEPPRGEPIPSATSATSDGEEVIDGELVTETSYPLTLAELCDLAVVASENNWHQDTQDHVERWLDAQR